jgi:hypothetical protein
MTTNTGSRPFIDSVIRDIIQSGTDRLMESRYFSDLRAGKLTTRRIQGFALQHYIHYGDSQGVRSWGDPTRCR